MGEPVMPNVTKSEQEVDELEFLRNRIAENAERVKTLGNWPAYVSAESLVKRVPGTDGTKAPGFDAGIACALGLIPAEKQGLAAALHAGYTPEKVAQVREEIKSWDPNSQTVFWLAACWIFKEGEVDEKDFLQQVAEYKSLVADPHALVDAAKKSFEKKSHSFTIKYGVPYGEIDGCIQGAYIAGYPFGVYFASNYGLYFIGTYEPSLGLENFQWSEEKDEKGRAKSGPVFGSKQFVKCATEEELLKALKVVKQKIAIPVASE